jgi:hypothetical protein
MDEAFWTNPRRVRPQKNEGFNYTVVEAQNFASNNISHTESMQRLVMNGVGTSGQKHFNGFNPNLWQQLNIGYSSALEERVREGGGGGGGGKVW